MQSGRPRLESTKQREYMRNWTAKNRKDVNEYHRNYAHNYILRTNSKIYVVKNKRQRPAVCEICNIPHNHLSYHHWDDEDLSKGIWLCRFCHPIAEVLDCIKAPCLEDSLVADHTRAKTLAQKYITLKAEIELSHRS